MGILQLKTALKGVAKPINLEVFRGKKIAIDTSCFLYQFLRSDICHKASPTAPMVYGFTKQIKLFRQYQVTPVYVFDGKPTEDKIVMGDRRKMDAKKKDDIIELDRCISQIRQYSTIAQVVESIDVTVDSKITDAIMTTEEESVDELIFSLQQQKNKKELQAHKPNAENIAQCKALFENFGIPTIQAEAEADAMLAKLNIVGLVDAVITTDTDQFAFGAQNVLLVESDVNDLSHYKITDVYNHLGLTHNEAVDFFIMCGCDYVKRIGGIGVVNALKLIKQNHTIENVISSLPKDKFDVPEDYLDKIVRARVLFLANPFGKIPESVTPELLEWKFDKDYSRDWLLREYPMIFKQFNKDLFPGGIQGSITQFFGKKPVKKTTATLPEQQSDVSPNSLSSPNSLNSPTQIDSPTTLVSPSTKVHRFLIESDSEESPVKATIKII